MVGFTAEELIMELDGYFKTNDLDGAYDCVCRWERKAKDVQDENLLLTVYNECLGLGRRLGKKAFGMKAVEEVVRLIEKRENLLQDDCASFLPENTDKALQLPGMDFIPIMLTNAATTSYAFGEQERSLELFCRAEKAFLRFDLRDSYEYTSFLNNRAGVFCQMGRYDEAERDYRLAIKRLKESGGYEGEIALTLVSLAHLTYDRWRSTEDMSGINRPQDERVLKERKEKGQLQDSQGIYGLVEGFLDEAWEWINAEGLAHDEKYAFVMTKLAPSYEYFKRPVHAKALKETAEEIYHNSQNMQ